MLEWQSGAGGSCGAEGEPQSLSYEPGSAFNMPYAVYFGTTLQLAAGLTLAGASASNGARDRRGRLLLAVS